MLRACHKCVNYTPMPQPGPNDPILSVSELNREARELLEASFPALWVEGEISNFIHHSSGHMYFDLKDERAQIRCAMFRGANRHLKFRPGNGDQVLLNGRLTLYEARGSFQLVVEHMEAAGEGLLRRRFEQLRARLEAEGLFSMEHKQALPELPRCIGVVTSPTGAAIRDILKVLRRRFPAVEVVIYPVQVQGERAKQDIATALATAGRRADCDLLIVGRGGGSLEDLWAFNEEVVVRAIHACPIPVISAVGHETDVTLADFVADQRAPTPSAAAEMAVPDRQDWLRHLSAFEQRAARAVTQQLQGFRQHLTHLLGRLHARDPDRQLQQHAQRLDELKTRLRRAMNRRLEDMHTRHRHALARLLHANPAGRITDREQALARLRLRLAHATERRLATVRQHLTGLAARLNGVSPLATLERGYALIQDPVSGEIIRSSAQLKAGQEIRARLAHGELQARVTKLSD